MQKSVLLAAERIKRLEVQGARNVAITAIKAIEEEAKESKAKQKGEFLRELSKAKDILFASRETEPFMRNAIRYVMHAVEKSDEKKVKELVDLISSVSKQFLKNLKRSKEEIANIGSKRIHSSSKILTHCHSSTVSHMLKRAKREGKSFEVICTESRPVFQGRITAKEMLDAGIKTTLIVDSAVRFVMNEVDLVVVGADAITSEGNVINKIGTSVVALAASEARTPFYVVSELLKFDPLTIYGDYEKIEERSFREIWEEPPQGLMIRNPAFDVTRRDFIHGIICEEGIISPHSIIEVVRRRYPWIFQ
ncbi:MAG: S-methyl-5-thioribose-1-phosphate isomerase [Candidatus Bathyarchaeota archaeon]|nr:S-methyl-5-thioribose-1-phosphate isomerase [Candidatus Bathyarchaeota archaeon]